MSMYTKEYRSSGYDSSFGSEHVSSQMQKSQPSSFSQMSTQGMFSHSQNISIPVDEQTPHSKFSMYEKWLNKKSNFKVDSVSSPACEEGKLQSSQDASKNIPSNEVTSRTSVNAHYLGNPRDGNHTLAGSSFFSSRNAMSRANVEEKNEKHLLEQVVQSVRESSTEIKSGLLAIQDRLQVMSSAPDTQLSQTVTQFLEDIWKHEEKVLNMLEEHNSKKSSTEELEHKLLVKDAEVKTLTAQLEQAKKDDTERLAIAMKQRLCSPQLEIKQQLEEILSCTRDVKEHQAKKFTDCKNTFQEQSKQCLSLCKSGQKNVKDIEKYVKSEFNQFRLDLNESNAEIRTAVFEELCSYIKNLLDGLQKSMLLKTEAILSSSNEKMGSTLIEKLKDAQHSLIKDTFETVAVRLEKLLTHHSEMRHQQLTAIKGTLAEGLSELRQSSKLWASHSMLGEKKRKESGHHSVSANTQQLESEEHLTQHNSFHERRQGNVLEPNFRVPPSTLSDRHNNFSSKSLSTPSFCKNFPVPVTGRYLLRSGNSDEKQIGRDVLTNTSASGSNEFCKTLNFSDNAQSQHPSKVYSGHLNEDRISFLPNDSRIMQNKPTIDSVMQTGTVSYISPFGRFSSHNVGDSRPSPIAAVLPLRQVNATHLQSCEQRFETGNAKSATPSTSYRNNKGKKRKRSYPHEKKSEDPTHKMNTIPAKSLFSPQDIIMDSNGRKDISQRVALPTYLQNKTETCLQGRVLGKKNKSQIKCYNGHINDVSQQVTLASFLNERNSENRNCEAFSEKSSPNLSFEEIIIHRKVGRPARKFSMTQSPGFPLKRGNTHKYSPAPTLLSLLSKENG